MKKKHSWSRILISQEILTKLISYYSVSPAFLKTIASFGIRTSEVDRSIGPFCCHISTPQESPSNGHPNSYGELSDSYAFHWIHPLIKPIELHYVLRYVEKNGRSLSDPWSMRKMAISHTFMIQRRTSAFVVIHASEKLRERTAARRSQEVVGSQGLAAAEASAASNHLVILSIAMENWEDYLEHLFAEFKERVSCSLHRSARDC
jgi:hypothetical protein